MTGIQKTGKPVNLEQLRGEIQTRGASATGLGSDFDYVYTFDAEGMPADFSTADQPIVVQALTEHVAMRDKTTAELSAEFQASGTTAARKQEIRDMQNGLMPMEQVPMTLEDQYGPELAGATPA